MRGREKFAKYKPYINYICCFYSWFPNHIQRWLWNRIRGRKGIYGLVTRYALLRNLAKSCGDNVAIDENSYIFNVENISIGNNVSINSMCYIDGAGGISIGDNVSIAHGTTIMSSSHNYTDLNSPIKDQGISLAPVTIGSNVWIGAKATILYGRNIAPDSIIGANTLVSKDIPTGEIWGGVPARKIKER